MTEWIQNLLFLIFGSFYGSWLSMVGIRISMAPHHELQYHWMAGREPFLAIPLMAIIGSRFGRLRRLSPLLKRYPLLEGLSGISFFLAYFYSLTLSGFLTSFLLLSLLIIVVSADLAYFIIPDLALLTFLISYGIAFFYDWIQLAQMFWLGGCLPVFIYCLMPKNYRHKLGAGDIKLLSVIGIAVGLTHIYIIMFIASVTALIYMGIQGVRHQSSIHQPMPFAPFIAVGTVAILLFS
ncbi:prepilin peptidase [Tuberibacillus sp. Marseille-P3662]|uniref:prepilin peptidase n=1 Tax=Tuberibacillus sp. Marseille-P3662 TaxID=1965358 RepID=UPI000A1C88D4|nr:A24 family peptidase [Tuberibacillus sp. Marseille-P3662]